jgi:DMSO/TMAO reductase YedYZ molybdopterin-dependent catalytic subunit
MLASASAGVRMNQPLESRRISRRALVASLATLPIAHQVLLRRPTIAAELPDLVIREREPQNFESNFSALDSFITANDQFYVRNHFAVPQIDPKSWRLKVEGAVKEPIELAYDELLRMPVIAKPVTLECAGNGRVFLTPKVDGAQWQLGAVGNANWAGVSLSSILDRAGVNAEAVDVILEGADAGDVSKPSRPAKPFHFARSVPLELARNGGILLAYKMNDQPLPEAHGYPLRAIVPGWYGMASVKWLSRIVVSDRSFQGFFQTVDYAYWQHVNGSPIRVPVTTMQVKAQIARPTFGEVVPKSSQYRISGAAWGGSAPISKIEVSTDGGKHYSPAKLTGDPVQNAWRLWEFPWTTPSSAGKVTLLAKATDSNGITQPLERDKDRENYMINHVLPIEVYIR